MAMSTSSSALAVPRTLISIWSLLFITMAMDLSSSSKSFVLVIFSLTDSSIKPLAKKYSNFSLSIFDTS